MLDAHWETLLADLGDTGDRAVFDHPMAGPMTLVDTLSFVEAHVGHHLHQLDRLQAADGYPAS